MSKMPGDGTDELTWFISFLSGPLTVPRKSGPCMKITIPFQTTGKIGNGEGITPWRQWKSFKPVVSVVFQELIPSSHLLSASQEKGEAGETRTANDKILQLLVLWRQGSKLQGNFKSSNVKVTHASA